MGVFSCISPFSKKSCDGNGNIRPGNGIFKRKCATKKITQPVESFD